MKKWLAWNKDGVSRIKFTCQFHEKIVALSGNLKFGLNVIFVEKKNPPQKITFIIRIVCNNIKPDYWRCGL